MTKSFREKYWKAHEKAGSCRKKSSDRFESISGELDRSPLFKPMSLILSEALLSGMFQDLDEEPSIEAADTVQLEPLSIDDFLRFRPSFDPSKPALLPLEKAVYQQYVDLLKRAKEKVTHLVHQTKNVKETRYLNRPTLELERNRHEKVLRRIFLSFERELHGIFLNTEHPTAIKKSTRATLPDSSIRVLKKWLFDHFDRPYPSIQEKEELAVQTGLKPCQVNYWFINGRVRVWKPLLKGMKGEIGE